MSIKLKPDWNLKFDDNFCIWILEDCEDTEGRLHRWYGTSCGVSYDEVEELCPHCGRKVIVSEVYINE